MATSESDWSSGTNVRGMGRPAGFKIRHMAKRALGTVLWFMAGWMGGGLIVSLTGLPAPLGLIPGIVIAGLIAWDPRGAIWSKPRTDNRVVRPINAFAADLERQAQRAASESDSAPV